MLRVSWLLLVVAVEWPTRFANVAFLRADHSSLLFPSKISGGPRCDAQGDHRRRQPIFHTAKQPKIVQLNAPRYQGHQGPSVTFVWNAPCPLLSSSCCSISR